MRASTLIPTTCPTFIELGSGFGQVGSYLKLGISGPAAAGVIGVRKFIYDLWGNTVNIASRLTTEATTGGILVDVTTYRRLRGLYEFEGPEPLKVKGLREITAYRLLGPLNH